MQRDIIQKPDVIARNNSLLYCRTEKSGRKWNSSADVLCILWANVIPQIASGHLRSPKRFRAPRRMRFVTVSAREFSLARKILRNFCNFFAKHAINISLLTFDLRSYARVSRAVLCRKLQKGFDNFESVNFENNVS